MKKILLLSSITVSFLLTASLAQADVKLHIEKTSSTTVDIKDLANHAEEESSQVASGMRDLFKEEDSGDESEATEVQGFVDAELGHKESSTASNPTEDKKSPN